MRKHHVTLTESISEMVDAQVKNGRYKDVSAALQDAAWHFFLGPPSPFADYGDTPASQPHRWQSPAGCYGTS